MGRVVFSKLVSHSNEATSISDLDGNTSQRDTCIHVRRAVVIHEHVAVQCLSRLKRTGQGLNQDPWIPHRALQVFCSSIMPNFDRLGW